jgi:type IV secretory pathway VirB3-like protein
MAFLVYFMIVLVLSTAVFLLVAGKPWLLIIALPVYLVAFSKIGCLSQH